MRKETKTKCRHEWIFRANEVWVNRLGGKSVVVQKCSKCPETRRLAEAKSGRMTENPRFDRPRFLKAIYGPGPIPEESKS